ncbi:MAG: protein kinase [Ignavibacteriae bacterium]|nr:protein kinase [Ignavibacteriota bacterium]
MKKHKDDSHSSTFAPSVSGAPSHVNETEPPGVETRTLESIAVPGYEIYRELHRGKLRVVYRGFRMSDRLPVIIKTSLHEFPSSDDTSRLKREYEIIHSLNIEGAVRAYALEQSRYRPVLILEDIGGESLGTHIAATSLSIASFLTLSIKPAAIVEELHQSNIIHKDIKPENIIINPTTGLCFFPSHIPRKSFSKRSRKRWAGRPLLDRKIIERTKTLFLLFSNST